MLPSAPECPDTDAKHGKADGDHDSETPKDDTHRWLQLVRERVQTVQRRIQIMFQDQTGEFWNLDGIVNAFFIAIGKSEQNLWFAIRVTIVMAFHCHAHTLVEILHSLIQNLREEHMITLVLGVSAAHFLFWVRNGLRPLLVRLGFS